MGVSADSVRLAIAPEATPGVIAAAPAFKVVRATGEGVSFAYESTTSNELGGEGRGVRDSILTGGAVTGPINFELAKDAAFEDMIAAVFGSAWGADPLAIGAGPDTLYVSDTLKTFTFEKRWNMGAGAPDPFLYHRYLGVVPDTASLTITPNQPITGSIGFVGASFANDNAEAAGATYVQPSTTPVMTAPLVRGISMKDSEGATVFDIGTACWTNLAVNFASNTRNVPCIGTLGSRESVLGRFEATIDYSVYFSSDFLVDALVAQEDFALEVTLEDALGNSYLLTFPRVRISTAETVAGGSGQDVVVSGQMVALVGVAPDVYSARIDRTVAVGGGPLPLAVSAAGAGPASTEVTITFSEGPATVAQVSADISLTADGGASVDFNVPISEGDTAADVASAVAAAIDVDAGFVASAVGGTVTVTPEGGATNITAASAAIS
ncbi:MAG: phage tail tube protein [Pikeienuella sp.]|uniref:phage tail tube protein n=1 Tax=Pikeienuella sp. TaxID=2831957 RepID=UPI00391CEB6A